MARHAKLLILIICCAAVIGVIKSIINTPPGEPVEGDLEVANARLDAIESALDAQTDGLPVGNDWASVLDLSDADVIDPFHYPDEPEPFGYWSDGEWYVITSIGPDERNGVAMMERSLDPEATLRSTRQFDLSLFEHRAPHELQSLLGRDPSAETIISDVRFRDAIYDATNGHLSQGDIVRWGRIRPAEEIQAPTLTEETTEPDSTPMTPASVEASYSPFISENSTLLLVVSGETSYTYDSTNGTTTDSDVYRHRQ